MIAYGLYGLEQEDIPDSLKTKMKDLIYTDEVTFDIKIKDQNDNVILQTKKINKNNKEVETFHHTDGKLSRMT